MALVFSGVLSPAAAEEAVAPWRDVDRCVNDNACAVVVGSMATNCVALPMPVGMDCDRLPHAAGKCNALGRCVPIRCEPGYVDEDGDPANGCEVRRLPVAEEGPAPGPANPPKAELPPGRRILLQ